MIEIKDQHARVIKPDDARSHLGSTDYELTLLYPSWHRCNNIALPCDHRFAFQAFQLMEPCVRMQLFRLN